MANYRRHPDPPYTPPTDVENDLGYWFDCPRCDRRWSQRYLDRQTSHCLGCARAWRREDKQSRRRGLGGIPLAKAPEPHPFKSRVLGREVNLNSAAAREHLKTNVDFRSEVDAYIAKLVQKNAQPKPPLHGVLPLLANPRRGKAVRVELDDDEPGGGVSPEAQKAVDKIVDSAMDVIEGEVVSEKKPRRRA